MGLSSQQITVEEFRIQLKSAFDNGLAPLTRWLEGRWARLAVKTRPNDPWTPQGRNYTNFGATFTRILAWYKARQMALFEQPGWVIDDAVTEKVRSAFITLIKRALTFENLSDEQRLWLKSYDPLVISRYTATGYRFQNLTGATPRNVLDFGSGIGRQAFQWCPLNAGALFSIDAIESLYVLQNHIYSILFPAILVEFCRDPEVFRQSDFATGKGQLFHLPTWEMDLLPDNHFDLVIAVQVLQELSEPTLRYVLHQFKRTTKRGGLLYIRDNDKWRPAHKVNVASELSKAGWEMVFKYTGLESYDIQGVPRLWVYTGEKRRHPATLVRAYSLYKRRADKTKVVNLFRRVLYKGRAGKTKIVRLFRRGFGIVSG